MRPRWPVILVAFGCGLLQPASSVVAREKEPTCDWQIDGHRVDTADAALYPEGDPRIEDATERNLPFGMPREGGTPSGEHLLAHEHYLIWYDDDLRAPLWVAARLTKAQAGAQRDRKNSFRSDPRLAEGVRSECADYSEPIFDQGHMVPRSDMNRSDEAMDNTYMMSNMSPQNCAFNRGPWEVLEALGRGWARKVDETWIVTGAVFDRAAPPGRDEDDEAWRMKGKLGRRVAIPSSQYKIMVRRDGTGWKTLSFMLPNNDMKVPDTYMPEYLQGHVTTLNTIKELSGFDFFDGATVSEETSLWKVEGAWPTSLAGICNTHYPSH